MERAASNKTLPDDLVERIISMMPFPQIFKTRGLSKEWLARFSSSATLNDEVKRAQAKSFQKQVLDRSNDWGTFFPVFVDCRDRCPEFCAYDWTSQNWVRLPSLDFNTPKSLRNARSYSCEGPLLGASFGKVAGTFYVTNIFTRSWKELPPCPNLENPGSSLFQGHESNVRESDVRSLLLVNDWSAGSYKVIGLSRKFRGLFMWAVHIYDSNTDAWISEELGRNVSQLASSMVYLNGVVYLAVNLDPLSILTLDLEDGTLRIVWLMFHGEIRSASAVHLLVCDAQLHMIVTKGNSARIMKIDVASQLLLEVSGGPPARLQEECDIGRPLSHAHYIFFMSEMTPMLAYNVRKGEWSRFHFPDPPEGYTKFPSNSFHPGLNPFSVV